MPRSPSQRADDLNYHKTKIQETDVFKRLDNEVFLETVNQISQILYVQNSSEPCKHTSHEYISMETLKNKSKEQKQ